MSGHTHTHIHTYTHDNYYNPRCAHAHRGLINLRRACAERVTHVRDGGKPFLCFYDIEKAFDSVELPILLRQLHTIGINGKLWRLLKHWYSTSSARVRVNGHISNSFNISRGVKQGSVLSPTLFLTVMDLLMKRLRESDCGLYVRGTYMGAAVHADDLRTTAASAEAVSQQNAVINQFARDSCLRLNTSKTEIVKISPFSQEESLVVELESHTLPAVNAAKCLGDSESGGTLAYPLSTLSVKT